MFPYPPVRSLVSHVWVHRNRLRTHVFRAFYSIARISMRRGNKGIVYPQLSPPKPPTWSDRAANGPPARCRKTVVGCLDLASSDWILLLERFYDFRDVIVDRWLSRVSESLRVGSVTNLPFSVLAFIIFISKIILPLRRSGPWL